MGALPSRSNRRSHGQPTYQGACMNRRGIGTAFGMFGAAVALIAGPTDISAQNCPPELAAAKSALSAAGPSLPDQLPRSLAGARDEISAPRGQDIQAPRGQDVQAPRGEDIQAPRTLVGSRQDLQAPRGQDVQAPRGQDVQAPRGQDVQAPRGQDVQAPRGQDVQAPRGQDVQAPRGQDVQAPRGQDIQAPRTLVGSRVESSSAANLVAEAEAACKAGDITLSAQKAKAALDALR